MNIERLVNDARPKLMGYALKHFTRSTDEAEDLVSTTILRAIKGFDGWDRRASFGVWATRILTNVYLDSRKGRSGQWRHLSCLEDLVDPVDGFDLAVDVIERDRLFRALAALKEKLGEDRFQTLIIGVTQSYEVAAKEIGLPVGTVKSRINRARLWLSEWEEGREETCPVGERPTKRRDIPWDKVRARWEKGAKVAELELEFGITRNTIRLHRISRGWARSVNTNRDMFDWAAMRKEYETEGLSIPKIAKRHGVTESHAYSRKKKEGWKKNQANLPEVLCA